MIPPPPLTLLLVHGSVAFGGYQNEMCLQEKEATLVP